MQSDGVCTDTRTLKENQLFFALRGEHFDGNRFLTDALEKGCRLAVTDNPGEERSDRVVTVPDSLRALQQLAARHRQQKRAKVVGLTGSNGKTTTKELITAVLRKKFRVLSTRGNLNNHIGVPLTLLEMDTEQVAVIEMGANHRGEIALLAELADPHMGLITNVGKAHLEGFGSLEGVKAGKGELYDYLAGRGREVFVNLSDKTLVNMAHERRLKIVPYATDDSCELFGTIVQTTPFLEVLLRTGDEVIHLQSRLVGSYNLENIMAAVAVGRAFNVTPDDIRSAIEEYHPANQRSEWLEGKSNRVVMDAYNANPTSMHASINDFMSYTDPPRAVILGDMLEVGQTEEQEHHMLLNRLTDLPLDEVLLVGPVFYRFKDTFRDFRFFEDAGACTAYLEEQPVTGMSILIKGSRRISLEQTTRVLISC